MIHGKQFIVGEVSKNYANGVPVEDTPSTSALFEKMIHLNIERGYALHSWRLDRYANGPLLNETIIAVFQWKGDNDDHAE